MGKIDHFLAWYEIRYVRAAGRWAYPTPCLPGIKPAGERLYRSLVNLVLEESLGPSMEVLFNVTYKELREYDESFHKLELVKK